MFKCMQKKLIAAVISLTMVLSAAVVLAAGNPFSDLPSNHWAYDAVVQLASEGINQGYGDGTFRGDNYITRYEAATMISKELSSKSLLKSGTPVVFADLESSHWAYDTVNALSRMGLVSGYSDGTFRGNQNITRYEMAMLIANVLKDNGATTATGATPFRDVSEDSWVAPAVKLLAEKGITQGYGDGNFRGNNNITRYEAASMLAKLLTEL